MNNTDEFDGQQTMLKCNFKIPESISLIIFLLFLFFAGMENTSAQTWTGAESNSWHDAGNWDSGSVPGANSTVTIRSVSPKPFPVITQNVTVKTINLPDWSSGELTVTSNATLTVTNTFDINNNGSLILDGGTLQFNGNDGSFNMGWTNTLIDIKNNGTLNSPNAHLQINGEVQVNNGTLNLGNGFQLSTGKLLQVTQGNINIFGATNIYGTINGGSGNFVFDGDISNKKHNVVIRSGGRFYMTPSSPESHPPNCDPTTPDPPVLSGGTIDFNIPSFVENNGRLYGGDAFITFSESTETQGDAGIEIHNGTIIFKGNSSVRNSGYMKITCEGTILVEGNSTFEQNGSIDIENGNFGVIGDAVFENKGTLNADEGDINFDGNVTIANSGGTINAGSSSIYFSGGTFDNSGTFNPGTSTFIFDGDGQQEITGKNSDITFYNLQVEDGANVNSEQNVLVLNDMTVDGNGEFVVEPGKTLDVVGNLNGDSNINTNRPYIIVITADAVNSITAVLNEALEPISAQKGSNYHVEDEAGNVVDYPSNPVLGGAGNNEITLTLGFSMVENEHYYLIVNNVKNLSGYTVSQKNHKKRFGLTEPAELWRWAGTVDSDWDKPGNWVKDMIPPVDAFVLIPVTANNPVISSQGNTVSEIKIETGASLTIGSTGNLTVSSTILNEAGNSGLVINSDTNGTGSLIHHNNGVPATFQRYVSGEPQDWQMISAPMNNQAIAGDFTPTGGDDAYGDNTRYDFYAWHEPDTSWVYLLNDNQPPTWNTTNGSNNYIPGRGYLVSYKDQHPTKSFAGNLNNGQIAVSVTSTAGEATQFGHNLLGNPYPSSIDWKAANGWNRENLISTGGGYEIWIWSESNQNYGAYNSASSSDNGTLGVSRYIAPNQGFFVKAAQSGTVTMNNSIRVHLGAGNWLKNASTGRNEKINILVESVEDTGRDEVIVEFGHPENAAGARKKFSFVPSAPALYIPGNEDFYSIRLVGEKEKYAVLPVSFKAGTDGNYKLTADPNFDSFEFLELYDKLTGTRHNLLEQPTYLFQAEPDDRTDRFVLQVVPGNFADPHSSVPVNIFARQKVLHVDMRLLKGQFYCDVYSLSGQKIANKILYGGNVSQISIPVSTSVVVVHISGNEGKMYKKVPVF